MSRNPGLAWALVGVGLATFGCSGDALERESASPVDGLDVASTAEVEDIVDAHSLLDVVDGGMGGKSDTSVDMVEAPDNGLGEPWPPEGVVAVFDELPYSLDVSGIFGIPGRFGETAYCQLCEGVRPFAFLWAISGSKCLTDGEKGCQEVYDSPDDMGAVIVDMAMRGQSGFAHTIPGDYAPEYESFDAETENLQVVTTHMKCHHGEPFARVLWRATCRQRIQHATGPMLIEYPIDRVMSCCGDGTPLPLEPGEGPGFMEVMVIYRFPKSCGGQVVEHRNTLESMSANGDEGERERHYCFPLNDEFIDGKPE